MKKWYYYNDGTIIESPIFDEDDLVCSVDAPDIESAKVVLVQEHGIDFNAPVNNVTCPICGSMDVQVIPSQKKRKLANRAVFISHKCNSCYGIF